ncbi:MAG: peptidyl-prolyl cis-trans isomerase [Planctomycetes bacterium]|nr:peptidyl-prolyl cis-trans isomerase [Planctomycetota bacterium]
MTTATRIGRSFASLSALLITALAAAQQPAPATPPAAAPSAPVAAPPVYAAMITSKGTIYLELDATKAPISVENFVTYAKDGFYSDTIFHRVIKGFMIQGGGHGTDMKLKPTRAPITNEWNNGLKNVRGTISMARTNAPNSATSQFFINTVDNAMLDQPRGGAAYAVFGKVVRGMDVVDAIANTPTGRSDGMADVPKAQVVIEKVQILPGPPAADAPTLKPSAPSATAPAATAPTTPATPSPKAP